MNLIPVVTVNKRPEHQVFGSSSTLRERVESLGIHLPNGQVLDIRMNEEGDGLQLTPVVLAGEQPRKSIIYAVNQDLATESIDIHVEPYGRDG